MSSDRVPAWEIPMLLKVVNQDTVQSRQQALDEYFTERERRRRHASVRDKRDRYRRTLVGAHVPREEAYMIAKMAEARGMSITSFVRAAVLRASTETAVSSARDLEPLWVTSLERGTW